MDQEVSTSYDVLQRILLDETSEPTSLPFSLLQYITNCFSLDHQIGKGGFAVVYKGMVGKGMVAVKKLSNTFGLHENKFHEEVKCLIKAKHKNIVRFLGYCAETQGKMEKYEGKLVMADQRNWLLCFEYVCNGSLDTHITDATCGLNWRERYRIIRGICEGLLFLHEMRVLHLDLKPANILLDSHMVPKITDFGISRCLGEDQTRAITENLHGTLGYMDPEYIRSGQITFASDIYSLGVIIMEILTGVKWYLDDEHVVESWMNRLDASEGHMQLEQVRLCSKIGIECMNLDPRKRPLTQYIIDRLDNVETADYSEETCIGSSLFERQVPRQQFGERTGNLAAESLQKADVEEHSEMLDDVRECLGLPHVQEGQQKDSKEKVNCNGASNSSSISTAFYKLDNLDFFNRKARENFIRNDKGTLEKSYFINIFRKEELSPILRSSINLIGKGVRTEVYRGVIDQSLVAVKKSINGNVLEKEQLENEIITQSQIIHKNIVWLLGCCLEMDTPILVYEFLPRGSLHDILHSGSKVPLNLDVRLNIIAESACGLVYLHSQAHNIILLGDFKPASILLDDNFVPKISHCGISKANARNKGHTGYIIGDKTYMDPIYLQTGILTEKSDVYSFGIVILEIISRKKATHTDDFRLVKSFLEVHEKGKKATELFDKEIVVAGNLQLLDCLAKIAAECCCLDVDQRPSMTDVARRLLILNQSRRSHPWHIVDKTTSAVHSVETDTSNLLVQQQKAGQLSLLGVQDTNRHGASISRSISTGLYKLKNLGIFNKKALKNIGSSGRRALENSSFIKIFRMEELEPIIKKNNLIGKGYHTKVYKGVVGNAPVVVKILFYSNVLENEYFENEIIIHSQVVHKNIVRLIGCCLEKYNSMLVYEFLSRGNLHDILHGDSKVPLSLDVRLAIAAESAQGLAYLHSQAHAQIVHGLVKPVSILLDDNFTAKISGFRLSKLIAKDKKQTRYGMETRACVDAVYMKRSRLDEIGDVYNFGIMILEVITRKKATLSDKHSIVRSFLRVHETRKKATDLFDKQIAVTAGDLKILDSLAAIAMECLNFDRNERPKMAYVAESLVALQRYHRSQVVR